MNEASSIVASEHSFFADEQIKIETEQNKNQIDFSKNSSNPEGIFDTLNKEIRCVVENCKDLSYYSNSNSKVSDQQQNNEQFLDSRYWGVRKNHNENDSSNTKNEISVNEKIEKNYYNNNLNERNKKNEKDINNDNYIEEKEIYINDEDENNKFDDFDEEDMEEKTIEKRENGINEINSIKVNKNNLNNKDNLTINNKNISNNTNNNGNNDLNKSKCATEPDDQFLILNEKLNPNHTPNKINQSFFPCVYNTKQFHSFISTYNNYSSTFSKGSFISTNNSSNNKYKKDEDHCSSEIEEEIRLNNNYNFNNDEIKNNNNTYNHGNKFGPHLPNYSQLSNNNINNINMETTNLANINNINNISNFNINNNFLYNRIPKMNLNMVYYIPVQQQPISTNTNFINNNKIYSNLNNIISDNNSIMKNKAKEVNKQNNTISNNNTNENNTNNKSSSEEKNKNNLINNSINNNIYNRNNNINNNYKNNTFRKNDNNNTNINSNLNNNANNIQCCKGEKNLLNLDDIVSGKDTRTTVMIRNIPIKYTDDTLIEALEEFKGKYDCLYMPFDYEKKGNKGYAFINFVNPLHILYFHEKFYGKKWQLFESSKICELNSANFQGIYEIQKHSKNYKGYKKPLFYSEQNNNNNDSNMIIPSKYLLKLKVRFPNMKYHENKAKKIIIVDSFE